ncbi:hypothetical protein F5Y10DRAFT_124290 [Nemania abortiva]|nr:hypothetical protein F5Y10DRAFT_124290 [Nemania abortiva]
MDSKHIPEEELPPPYSVHGTQGGSLTSHLQQNLASLPNRIRMNQEAHSVQQSLDDASLVELLVPKIYDFFSYLGGLRATPKLSHLVLIPEAAVPHNAILSGMDEMHKNGELCRLARVNMNLGGDEKKPTTTNASNRDANTSEDWPAGQEFSDWGRFGDSRSSADPSQAEDMLWWKDENMARRLARLLRPMTNRDEPAPLQSPVQATVEERIPAQKEQRRWFWSRKGNGSNSTSTHATESVRSDVETFPGRDNPVQSTTKAQSKEKSGAIMSVTAKEVAFRTENEFGLVGSISGWAVVVVVDIET